MASSTIVAAGSARAQWSARLDAGAASVTYEGYLGAAAVALAPAAAWSSARAAVVAGGAFTHFETGHASGSADLGARWTLLDDHPIRVDLVADEDASRYQSAPVASRSRFGSGVQVPAGDFTISGAASLGQLVQGDDARPVSEVSVRADRRLSVGTVGASLTAHWVGTVPYADAQAVARIGRGPLVVTAVAGARQISVLSGRQVWAHADLAVGITSTLALTAGAGSYPRDLTVNAPGGQYVVIGLRLQARSHPRFVRSPTPPPAAPAPDPGHPIVDPESRPAPADPDRANHPLLSGAGADVPLASVSPPAGEWTVLHIAAPRATRVEVRGDFTGWQGVPLDRASDGTWAIRIAPAPGVHRFEISVDQGPWAVPGGVTRVADDFGGFVGLFVVP